MKFKINLISGFKFSFVEIANVFNVLCNVSLFDNKLKEVANNTAYNERKTKILINFLVECGTVESRTYEITNIGHIIHEYDAFLEDIGTIWIMHYIISSKEHLIIWNRMFNAVIDNDAKNRENMMIYFDDVKNEIAEYTFERNVRKEIKMVLDAYINERFCKLDLINFNNNEYSSNRNGNIPELILLLTILLYKDKYYPGSTTINIKDICCTENSPGRLLFLDEFYLRSKLEVLKNQNLIGLESRADLDQIRLGNDLTVEGTIKQYYQSIRG